jgi:DHA2 family metal-tetracycline-proton antiporter-like MFS transporter
MNPTQEREHRHAERLLLVLVFTLILSVMNATMFNVALPVISAEFDLTPSAVSWMLGGYMIVYAIGSVTYGKLADKYRLKDLLTFGLLFFIAGSVVGLSASNYGMVIAGRLLQSAGASVIPATAMIIPVRYFPVEKRGRALGTTAIGLSLGAALGPIVSGLVSGLVNWRWLFALPVLTLFVLPFFRKYLDDETGSSRTIDLLGGVLLAGTVGTLLLAITNASWPFLLLGLLLLVLFVLRIRSAAEPFVQLSVFRNKAYSLGLALAFVLTGLNFAIPYLAPQFLARLNDLSPLAIGFVLFPAAICSALLGRRGGKIADERGNRTLFAIAAVLLFVAFVSMSTVVGLSPIIVAVFLIFSYVGQTFIQIAMSNTVSQTLPKEQTGVGMGLFAMMNFIAGAAATAVIGKALDAGTTNVRLNPVPPAEAALFSNVFLCLAVMIVIVSVVYFVQFGSVAVNRVRENRA